MGSPTSLLSFFNLIFLFSFLSYSFPFPPLSSSSLPRASRTSKDLSSLSTGHFLSSPLYYTPISFCFIYLLLMPFFHYQFFCRIIRNTPPRFQFIVLNRRSPGQSLYYMHFFVCSRFVFFQLVFCIVSHSFHLGLILLTITAEVSSSSYPDFVEFSWQLSCSQSCLERMDRVARCRACSKSKRHSTTRLGPALAGG